MLLVVPPCFDQDITWSSLVR